MGGGVIFKDGARVRCASLGVAAPAAAAASTGAGDLPSFLRGIVLV